MAAKKYEGDNEWAYREVLSSTFGKDVNMNLSVILIEDIDYFCS